MHPLRYGYRPRSLAVFGLAAMLAAAALSGCGQAGSADAGAEPNNASAAKRHYGRIVFDPCTLSTPYASGTIAAQCAQFEVPENAAEPKGRKLKLNLAWLPATDEAGVAEDPVFFLAGGPGQAATESWPSVDAAFREVRKHRHIVLIDQRGTGKSSPLACRDATGENAAHRDEAAQFDAAVQAVARCARQLGVDAARFTTSDAIADLDAVRAAIGAAKIDLVGISYGTRVAQQYATRYPQHTRSVVLDGVVPNELVLGSDHARNLDNALALQFKLCQQVPACRARFGADPREQLRQLMARLQTPVEVDYRDPHTGEQKRAPISAAQVGMLTRMFSYAPEAASLLPLVLNEADQGRYAPLMALSKMIESQLNEELNYGMQLSVICAEDADLIRPDPRDADTVMGEAMTKTLIAQCKVWPTGSRPKDFHAPFKSNLPTLLLSGELDPVTPPRYGDQVVKHLPNGRHLILRGQGHGALRIGCTPKLLGQFVETADAKKLDARCLDALGYVPPFVSFNGWEP